VFWYGASVTGLGQYVMSPFLLVYIYRLIFRLYFTPYPYQFPKLLPK
jgi:hypothetical protein